MGPFETTEACSQWKKEYELPFEVIPDKDGTIFKRLSNGWVPYSILVGPDGKVVLWESEFQEAGFVAAIEKFYQEAAHAPAQTQQPSTRAMPPRVGRASGANIVILGGGVGGLVAAHHLRRALSRRDSVILVDRSPNHLFQSSLLWHAVGLRRTSEIQRPLSDLTRKGIEFINEEVLEIDVSSRHVRTTLQMIEFDYLVVALGAQLRPGEVEGFGEMALNLYDLEGTRRIHTALNAFSGGTVGVLVTDMPFKCPAAPYEAALLVDSFLRKKGVRGRSEIHIYTPEHQPMPIAGPAMGGAIAGMLRTRDISYHPLFPFEKMNPREHTIVASGGEPQKVDLLLAVPPHRPPEVVRSSGLIGSSGWMETDPHTLATEHEGVYAIGDVNNIRLANGKNLPMAGVFAHSEAGIVAERIAAEIDGRTSEASFNGKGSCWLELGGGKAGFASGNFYAEPEPTVHLYPAGRPWHWGKVLFERWWLHHWF
ncbi:MAG: FAD-dependent oxidoreductase [Acidobacteria bacterium]|nr:FAD-dependent oxidoreductase [Acidobacteriota bacterium]